MDIERFMGRNAEAWRRLDVLVERSTKLTGDEVEELSRLYQRTAGHLSYARSHYRDIGLHQQLTRRVASAGAVLYGTRPRSWRSVGRFFTHTFPAAMYETRWFILVAALAMLVPALVTGVWIAHSPTALNSVGSPALRAAYVNNDFGSYYRNGSASVFATAVYTNNVRVAFSAFVGGIGLGIPTLLALIDNGINVGVGAGLFYAAGRPGYFWGLILPHGMLELTSVTIAAAAGLRIGWSLIEPGDQPRSLALTDAAKRAGILALGTVLTLAVSGLIEGFVTGSSLPTALRVGIGALVELAFGVWVIGRGRVARAEGFTAALQEVEPRAPTAARQP